jgi:hypothetical protein
MKISTALQLLVDTDEICGRLKGSCDALEYQIKVMEATGYLEASGTQDERKSRARTTEAYIALTRDYGSARIDYEIIAAKRKTAELTIEVWRSVNANRRRGNI